MNNCMKIIKVYSVDDGLTFEGTRENLVDVFFWGLRLNASDDDISNWCKNEDMTLKIEEMTYQEWDKRTTHSLQKRIEEVVLPMGQ